MTLLASILKAQQAAAQFNLNYESGPVCVIWPDKERLWEALAATLRRQSPGFLQLGGYAPENKTGPALWLKCVLAGLDPQVQIPSGTIPVLYLPGVGRSDFRNVESCPGEWQPLIELQYRGTIWSHPNGRDWTVAGFLSAGSGGLGLEVAKDARTSIALQQALVKLADVPVQRLQQQQIDADYLLSLLHPDPPREVLRWLNNSAAFKTGLSADQWDAFKAVCRGTYQFDPELDGELRAAELLGNQKSAWREVWERFREAPNRYPGIPDWLRRACPPKQMELGIEERPGSDTAQSWPQVNDDAERVLREVFTKLEHRSAPDIRKIILESERVHGPRREWVWAELGRSPLAKICEPLAELARRTEKPLAAADLASLGDRYESDGWQADYAVVRVLSLAMSEADRALASKIVRALYLPWLEETAQNFQHLAKQSPAEMRSSAAGVPPPGTVFLFADALRLDLAKALTKDLDASGLEVSFGWRWSALPSVTPTAKPAVSPIAGLLGGDLMPAKEDVADFRPVIAADNKSLTPDRFRKLLQDSGVQFLPANETGNPDGVAWTEHGRLDADGHHDGARLALRCAEHLQVLVERVEGLAAAGWQNIRIVTDHGWLLVPGNLPTHALPKYLTESRWGRCSLLAEGAQSTLPTWPWTWCPAIQIACPPGISSFASGREYAHGGVTLQECCIPEIHIRNTGATALPKVKIVSIKWVNFRCRVTLEGETDRVIVDLRLRPADPISSVIEEARSPDANGVAALFLLRDDLLGTSASAVVVATNGKVVQKMPLTLGEDTP